MEYVNKIVNFEYCKTCKHYEEDDYKDPCHDCLNNPTNINSRKPLRYEEKENKK